jgi:hypothetical protein
MGGEVFRDRAQPPREAMSHLRARHPPEPL